jgi:ubiquinone biosynthesis protein COQ9
MNQGPRDTGFEAKRKALLLAALPIVAFDGWTEQTLLEAARDLDIDAQEAKLLFPQGVADLLTAYSDWADEEMVAKLEAVDLEPMKIRERITLAVRSRIEVLAENEEAARRASSLLALPTHAGVAARSVYRTVDLMWRAIGDTSTDFNFYSKRATLAGVFGSTLLCWLSDSSEDFEETWEFLDRRIEEVMVIEKLKARARKVADQLPSPAEFLAAIRYPGTSTKR